MKVFERLLSLSPFGGDKSRRPSEGDESGKGQKGADREILEVLNGKKEPKGPKDRTPRLAGGDSTSGRTVDANAVQVRSVPVRPSREFFRSDEEFDAAYLQYQDKQVMRAREAHPGATYRGVLHHGADQSPEELRARDGLSRKGEGDNFDIFDHHCEFRHLKKPPEKYSALRGACVSAEVPAGLAGTGHYVFIIEPRGGAIDVEQALGNRLLKGASAEHELCFGARQPWCQIKGWLEVGKYNETFGAYRLKGPFWNDEFDPER